MTKNVHKWHIIWAIWAVQIAVSFAFLETLSWKNGVTLSRSVWDLEVAWPLSAALLGGLFLSLLVHFYWHWNPPGSPNEG